jgi:glutathione S-transferase
MNILTILVLLILTSIYSCCYALNADYQHPNVTVRYFDSRGRAEAIRLTLAALGIPFKEVKYARCGDNCEEGFIDWPTAKAEGIANGMLPFGQVPSTTYDGKHLVQSLAILQYICSQNHCSALPHEEYDVMAFVGGYNDLRSKYSKMVYDSTIWNEGSTIIQDYKDTSKVWLGYLESLLKENAFVGGEPLLNQEWGHWTWADILAFEIFDMNIRVSPEIIDQYPKLQNIAFSIARMSGVQFYLESDGRRPHQNGASAFFDNPEHPIVNPFDWTKIDSTEL